MMAPHGGAEFTTDRYDYSSLFRPVSGQALCCTQPARRRRDVSAPMIARTLGFLILAGERTYRGGLSQLRIFGRSSITNVGDRMAATDTDRREEYAKSARRIAEEAWSEGDLEVVDEILSEDFVSHNTGAREDVRGPEGYKELIATYRSAMPDFSLEVEETVVEGDRVALRFSMRGTHEGELMGIDPTGTEVDGSGLVVAHFDDGRIVEAWEYADQLGLLQQLGVVELPGE